MVVAVPGHLALVFATPTPQAPPAPQQSGCIRLVVRCQTFHRTLNSGPNEYGPPNAHSSDPKVKAQRSKFRNYVVFLLLPSLSPSFQSGACRWALVGPNVRLGLYMQKRGLNACSRVNIDKQIMLWSALFQWQGKVIHVDDQSPFLPCLEKVELDEFFVRAVDGQEEVTGAFERGQGDDQLPKPCHMRQRDLFFVFPLVGNQSRSVQRASPSPPLPHHTALYHNESSPQPPSKLAIEVCHLPCCTWARLASGLFCGLEARRAHHGSKSISRSAAVDQAYTTILVRAVALQELRVATAGHRHVRRPVSIVQAI